MDAATAATVLTAVIVAALLYGLYEYSKNKKADRKVEKPDVGPVTPIPEDAPDEVKDPTKPPV